MAPLPFPASPLRGPDKNIYTALVRLVDINIKVVLACVQAGYFCRMFISVKLT